jgi:hypothetical protein
MKLNLLLGLFLFSYGTGLAQNMAVNNDGSRADTSAILHLKSNSRGLLIPSMTQAQRNSIYQPATGLLIYQTDNDFGFFYNSGNASVPVWLRINDASNDYWSRNTSFGYLYNTTFSKVGINETAPFTWLANNSTNTQGSDNVGLNSFAIDWGANGPGYVAGFYNSSSNSFTNGVLIKTAGTSATNYLLDISTGATKNAAGTPVFVVRGNTTVGIGTSTPFSALANNSVDITGTDGLGLNNTSINWMMNTGIGGYVTGLYNASDVSGGNGLSVKLAGTTSTNRILDLSTGTQNGAATPVMVVNGNRTVGIGTATPSSTLQVDGTIAVGVTMGLAGGPIATPVSLANQKTYIGCSPADNTNNFYQLPSAASVPGRIYYIRNNSSSFFANIVSAGGIIFPGASDTGAGGNTYTLNPAMSVKTVICISDGTNWTVGSID